KGSIHGFCKAPITIARGPRLGGHEVSGEESISALRDGQRPGDGFESVSSQRTGGGPPSQLGLSTGETDTEEQACLCGGNHRGADVDGGIGECEVVYVPRARVMSRSSPSWTGG